MALETFITITDTSGLTNGQTYYILATDPSQGGYQLLGSATAQSFTPAPFNGAELNFVSILQGGGSYSAGTTDTTLSAINSDSTANQIYIVNSSGTVVHNTGQVSVTSVN